AINLVWFFPVIFYLSLHLTTPHNVLILLTCAVVFASLSYLRDCIPAFHLIILSLAGLAIHALLGAPLFIFVLAILILKKIQKLKVSFLIFYLVGLTFLFPVLFSLYFLLTNNPLPEISNPLRHVYSFLELFRQPYWYKPNAPFLWELLYHWQRILPVLIGLGACISFLFVAKKKKLDELYLLFLFSFIGLWGGAFLLRSWIIFPNVGVFEQGDYPLRLVKSSIIFLIPFLMYGAYMCGMYIHKKITDIPKVSVLIKFFGLFVLSIFITVSLYLAYPQQNAKAHFPGYNVTHADFEAARWIHQQNENYDYIVLSNPLTAIAAMTEYGFPKYFETSAGLHSYYSIPTGAPLFKLYQRMLYEGQEREYMEEAMEFAGVNKSYFVVSSFWSRFDQIVEGAQKSANSWQIIDNGKIWIFLYLKNE
ncbi:MAG: hypothetical protein COU33_01035, partial [Candidatus Magasanikbacteria bacterium CG10_big_fil_rev_8_21_14_0_10_43_6]